MIFYFFEGGLVVIGFLLPYLALCGVEHSAVPGGVGGHHVTSYQEISLRIILFGKFGFSKNLTTFKNLRLIIFYFPELSITFIQLFVSAYLLAAVGICYIFVLNMKNKFYEKFKDIQKKEE